MLEERELLASTAIGDGIAIPHGKLDAVGHLVGTLGRSARGSSSSRSTASRPTWSSCWSRPPARPGVHLKALARLSRLFRDADFRQRLLAAPDAAAMYQVIADEDAKY